jgi:hypothetical protein
MDPAAVRSLLATSLDPDADSRRRAELQLKQVRLAFAFCVEGRFLCLGIVKGHGQPPALLLGCDDWLLPSLPI